MIDRHSAHLRQRDSQLLHAARGFVDHAYRSNASHDELLGRARTYEVALNELCDRLHRYAAYDERARARRR